MRNRLILAAAFTALSAGCGSTPRERDLTLVQSQPTTRPAEPFTVDTSALPDWAVKHHTERDDKGNPHTRVTIEPGVPVRVIVVPATRPASTRP